MSPDTHLVGTLGITIEGAAIYALGVLVLFGLYGVALALVLTRRARPSPGSRSAASGERSSCVSRTTDG